MPHYRVLLTRSYQVDIAAEDEEQALRLSELYLGDCPDLSTPQDREERHFSIQGVEMAWNEAIEVEPVA
jgi:hypothetical protein